MTLKEKTVLDYPTLIPHTTVMENQDNGTQKYHPWILLEEKQEITHCATDLLLELF